jgi:hypothetical protein
MSLIFRKVYEEGAARLSRRGTGFCRSGPAKISVRSVNGPADGHPGADFFGT